MFAFPLQEAVKESGQMPQNRIKRSARSISSCPVKERETEEREALSIEVFREGNTKDASVTHKSEPTELARNSKSRAVL